MKSQKVLSVPAFLLAAGILFTSCKKDDAPVQKCNIITVAASAGPSYSITYNSSGQPETVSSGNTVSVYSYSGNLIVINTTTSGAFNTKKTITLAPNGFASNVKTETSANGSTWYNNKYEFNGTEVIKSTYTNSQGVVPEITTIAWSGGNIISTTTNGNISTIEYFTDKLSQQGDYLALNQLIQGYNVYKTKNIIKSQLSNGDITNFDYTYQDGKIATLKVNGSGQITTYNLQYQCQ